MSLKSLFLLLTFAVFFGCEKSNSTGGLKGLWALEIWEVDGVVEQHTPYFLQMNQDGSFAVAKRSGDLRGFYDIKESHIRFSSADKMWFDQQWKLEVLRDKIRLTGKGDYRKRPYYQGGPQGELNTRLTFSPVTSIPDFQAFEDAMSGKWELYKIRKKGNHEKVGDTWMLIENGEYTIAGPDHFESGLATINTRYRKVYFEGQDTSWDAWFYGEELRLSNKTMEMIYSLRR